MADRFLFLVRRGSVLVRGTRLRAWAPYFSCLLFVCLARYLSEALPVFENYGPDKLCG